MHLHHGSFLTWEERQILKGVVGGSAIYEMCRAAEESAFVLAADRRGARVARPAAGAAPGSLHELHEVLDRAGLEDGEGRLELGLVRVTKVAALNG